MNDFVIITQYPAGTGVMAIGVKSNPLVATRP
jgi:hypothetical protein